MDLGSSEEDSPNFEDEMDLGSSEEDSSEDQPDFEEEMDLGSSEEDSPDFEEEMEFNLAEEMELGLGEEMELDEEMERSIGVFGINGAFGRGKLYRKIAAMKRVSDRFAEATKQGCKSTNYKQVSTLYKVEIGCPATRELKFFLDRAFCCPRSKVEPGSCADDLSMVDKENGNCPYYTKYSEQCGMYDSEYFKAKERCCACGGGYKDGVVPTEKPNVCPDKPICAGVFQKVSGGCSNKSICSICCTRCRSQCSEEVEKRKAALGIEAPKVEPKPAPKPEPKPESKSSEPEYKLIKSGHECADNANEKNLGTFDTIEKCFNACKNHSDCQKHRGFIYGTGDRKGKCWSEGVSHATCTKWAPKSFDFYELEEETYTMKRSGVVWEDGTMLKGDGLPGVKASAKECGDTCKKLGGDVFHFKLRANGWCACKKGSTKLKTYAEYDAYYVKAPAEEEASLGLSSEAVAGSYNVVEIGLGAVMIFGAIGGAIYFKSAGKDADVYVTLENEEEI